MWLPENVVSDLESRKKELEKRKAELSLRELEKKIGDFSLRSLKENLKKKGLSVIAELKKASPSKGLIREDFSLSFLVKELEEGGADAFSILTEEHFFQGKIDYLRQVREMTTLPLLRKDFIFDPYQLFEARAYGADAVLLIVGILKERELKKLITLSKDIGLEVLVETSSREEIDRALNSGAEIIGVNNRDLSTFEVDLERSLELVSFLPREICKVAESGVKGGEDARELRKAGFDAVLVGEALMRAEDLKSKLKELKIFQEV